VQCRTSYHILSIQGSAAKENLEHGAGTRATPPIFHQKSYPPGESFTTP
jgi:hypothetical protein